MNCSTPPNLVGIKPSRYVWVDAAKGVAILLVLLSHSDFWNLCRTASAYFPGIEYGAKLISYATASYMPLFYVLSGYTFRDTPDVLKNRFRRLITPYVIWGIFALLLSWVHIGMVEHSFLSFCRPAAGICYSRFALYPLGSEPNIMLFPPGASPLWFLTSLFTSYVLFILLYKYKRFLWFLIAIYVVATVAMSQLPVLLPWSLDTAPAGALFLYAGYTVKSKNIFSLSSYQSLFIFIGLSCTYVYLVHLNGAINMSVRQYGRIPFLSPILFLLIGGVGSYLYCLCCQTLEKVQAGRILAYIGKISLVLLCSHAFVFAFVRKLTAYIYLKVLHTNQPCLYLCVVEIISAVMCAIFLTRIVKWWKARKLV